MSTRVIVLVHGGAGTLRDEAVPTAVAGVSAAVKRGLAALLNGRSALDAVEEATVELEDRPFFNAGRGSVLTREGSCEMDALIVDGRTVHPGSCTMVRTVKNPIRCARKVMECTPHVFIAAAGAEALAAREGLEIVPPEYFITEIRRKQLERALAEQCSGVVVPTDHVSADSAAAEAVNDVGSGRPAPSAAAAAAALEDRFAGARSGPEGDEGDHDTVGAVAIDAYGNVAAATSTGGLTAKWAGRIGDTPVFGCGGYADNTCGAASTTGTGEFIIRSMLARSVCDAYERLLAAAPPSDAASASAASAAAVSDADAIATRAAVAALQRMQDKVDGPGAGLIYVSPAGGVGIAHSSPRMSWAAAVADVAVAPSSGSSGSGSPAAASSGAGSAPAPPAGTLSVSVPSGSFNFAAGHELPIAVPRAGQVDCDGDAKDIRGTGLLPWQSLPLAALKPEA